MKYRKTKRRLSIILIAVLMLSIVPNKFAAYAKADETHTHTESCYAQEGDLLCSLEESEGHTHNEDCYCTGGEYICDLEASEEHTHSDDCICIGGELICKMEECEGHMHDDDCFAKGGELICGLDEISEFYSKEEESDYSYIKNLLSENEDIDFDPETQSLLIIDIDAEISEHLRNFGLSDAELESATEFSFLYEIYLNDTFYDGICYAIDANGNITANESVDDWHLGTGTPITDTARNVIITEKDAKYSVMPYMYKFFWGNEDVEPYENLMYVPMPVEESEIEAKTGTVSDDGAEIKFSYLWDVYNWFELETWYVDKNRKYCEMAGDFDFYSSVDYIVELRDSDGNISTFDTVYWDYWYDDDYTYCKDGIIHQEIEPNWNGYYGEGSFMFPAGYDFRIRVWQNGTELGTLMFVHHETYKSNEDGIGNCEYDEEGFCLCAGDYLTADYIVGHYFIQPSSTIRVEKQVQGMDSDQSYDFSIKRTVTEAAYKPNFPLRYELYSDITIPMINTNYTVYDSKMDEKVGTGRTDRQGKFSLKGGQYAIFDVWEEPADIEDYTDDCFSYLDIRKEFSDNNETLPKSSLYAIIEELSEDENCTTKITNTQKKGAVSNIDGKVIKGVSNGDNILFQNVYKNDDMSASGGDMHTPNPALVTLKASKTMNGSVPADSFTFALKNENGDILQTTQNQKDVITFDTLSYSSVGTYIYTISELAGTDENIKYDETVYRVIVELTKSNDYTATVTYEKDGQAYSGIPTFDNITITSDEEEPYTPPKKPDTSDTPTSSNKKYTTEQSIDDVPKTEDGLLIELWIALLLISAIGMFVSYRIRKWHRRRHRN